MTLGRGLLAVSFACVACGGEGNEGAGPGPTTTSGDSVRCLEPENTYFTYFEAGSNYSDGVSISSLVYAYPSGLTTGFSETLHVTGIVSTYAGVGVSFGACVDASEFTGIEFDAWGNVGPTGALTVVANTRGSSPAPPFTETGTCEPADPMEPYRSCQDSYAQIDVPAAAARVRVPFSSFAYGLRMRIWIAASSWRSFSPSIGIRIKQSIRSI